MNEMSEEPVENSKGSLRAVASEGCGPRETTSEELPSSTRASFEAGIGLNAEPLLDEATLRASGGWRIKVVPGVVLGLIDETGCGMKDGMQARLVGETPTERGLTGDDDLDEGEPGERWTGRGMEEGAGTLLVIVGDCGGLAFEELKKDAGG
jgi:hypothetical protein